MEEKKGKQEEREGRKEKKRKQRKKGKEQRKIEKEEEDGQQDGFVSALLRWKLVVGSLYIGQRFSVHLAFDPPNIKLRFASLQVLIWWVHK